METCCNYTGKTMYVSTDEWWLIRRLLKLFDKYPEEVEIIATPENNDGCLYCKLPAKWLRIAPPAKRELTEEQKAAGAERLQHYREQRRNEVCMLTE